MDLSQPAITKALREVEDIFMTRLFERTSRTVELTEAGCVDRKTLKARRNAEFSSRLENGVNLCIEGCVSAGNDDQMECLIKAKTAKASKACLD